VQWIGQYLDHPRKAMTESFQLVKQAVTNLMQSAEDTFFIIKIHPTQTGLKKIRIDGPEPGTLPNTCYCDTEFIVEELMAVSDLWISLNSSSTVEAWLHGLPTLNIQMGKMREILPMDFEQGTYLATGQKELLEFFERIVGGEPLSAKAGSFREDFIQKRFFKRDGKSYLRVADAIEEYQQMVSKGDWKIFRDLPADALLGQSAVLLDRLAAPLGIRWQDLFNKKLRLIPGNEISDTNCRSFFSYLQDAINDEVFRFPGKSAV